MASMLILKDWIKFFRLFVIVVFFREWKLICRVGVWLLKNVDNLVIFRVFFIELFRLI